MDTDVDADTRETRHERERLEHRNDEVSELGELEHPVP
jgi:hypothetical protein